MARPPGRGFCAIAAQGIPARTRASQKRDGRLVLRRAIALRTMLNPIFDTAFPVLTRREAAILPGPGSKAIAASPDAAAPNQLMSERGKQTVPVLHHLGGRTRQRHQSFYRNEEHQRQHKGQAGAQRPFLTAKAQRLAAHRFRCVESQVPTIEAGIGRKLMNAKLIEISAAK